MIIRGPAASGILSFSSGSAASSNASSEKERFLLLGGNLSQWVLFFFVFLQITNFVIDPDFLHHMIFLFFRISCTLQILSFAMYQKLQFSFSSLDFLHNFFTAPYFATDFVIHLDFFFLHILSLAILLDFCKLQIDPVLFAKLQFFVDSNILQNKNFLVGLF